MRYIAIWGITTTGTLLVLMSRDREQWQAAMAAAGLALQVLFWYLLTLGAIFAIVFAGAVYNRYARKSSGAVPLQRIQYHSWLGRLGYWMRGYQAPHILYDRTKHIGPVLCVHPLGAYDVPLTGQADQVRYSVTAERTRQLQVLVSDSNFGRHPVNAPVARLLAGSYDKAKPAAPAPAQIEQRDQAQALAPLPLERALQRSGDTWIMGYNQETRQICYYDPHGDLGIAVAGGAGTGKTMGAGYLALLHAKRHGWHVVVLDGKQGVDFRWLAPWVEYHESTPGTIGAQLAGIVAEHKRRQSRLAEQGASTLGDIPDMAPRTLILIEEFGYTLEVLEDDDKAGFAAACQDIRTIARLGRATGLHMAVLDQTAEKWPNPLMSACRRRLVYKVDTGTASKLQEWHAGQLEGVGVFMSGNVQYRGWDMKPIMRQHIEQMPKLNGYRVIDGDAAPAQIEAADPEPKRTWLDFGWDYLPDHPEILNGQGITQMARAMAVERDGHDGNYLDLKSAASDTIAKMKQAKISVGGEPFGVDIATVRNDDHGG